MPAAASLPVVVGVDDSSGSLAALKAAADEAARRSAELIVAHVWHFPKLWGARLTWPEEVSPASYFEQRLENEAADMQAGRAADG